MCSDPVAANSSTARAPSIGPQRNLRKRNRRLAPVEQRRFLRKRNGRRRRSCSLSIRRARLEQLDPLLLPPLSLARGRKDSD
jgi:hypothetical protein